MSKDSNQIIAEDILSIANAKIPWEKLSGCRVVVTGAGGFLGRYIIYTLISLYRLGKVSKPINVVGLVRNVVSANDLFSRVEQDGQLSYIEWDLNSIALPDLGDVNYIIHAASQASPRFYSIDPIGTLMPNAVGTATLLQALQKSIDPRGFLFVSSSEVYGSTAVNTPLRETDFGVSDPATVRACYSESKRLGETMCMAWDRQFNIPTFIVRPFHTYGHGLLSNDGRVFADFVFNILHGENIAMSSDGSARRAFCYVSDAIAGFFTVLLAGQHATAYNVANPNGELSIMELAEMLVALYPEKGLKVDRIKPREDSSYMPTTFNRLVPNVDRLMGIGWVPKINPQEGFQRMIEAYLQEGTS